MLNNNEEENKVDQLDLTGVELSVPRAYGDGHPNARGLGTGATADTQFIAPMDANGLQTPVAGEDGVVPADTRTEAEKMAGEMERQRDAYLAQYQQAKADASSTVIQGKDGYQYTPQMTDGDKWKDTLLKGAAALFMTAMPAAGIAAAAMTWMGNSDRQHRQGQIRHLEEKGYKGKDIQAWIDSGDHRLLAEDKVDNKFVSLGAGKMGNVQTGEILGGTTGDGKKIRDKVDLGDKVRVWYVGEEGYTDIPKGKLPNASGDDTGVSDQFAALSVPRRVGTHQGNDGKQYKVKQSTTGKLYIEGLDESSTTPNKISAGAEKNRDEAYSIASDLSAKADAFDAKATELTELVNSGKYRSGIYGKGVSWVLGALGSQDDVEGAKSDYRALRNDAVIQAMPPGPASDNDIRIFSSGFPDDSWDGAKQAAWLRGRAKVMRYKADIENFKGDYYSKNNGLGMSDGKTYNEHRKVFIADHSVWGTKAKEDIPPTSTPDSRGAEFDNSRPAPGQAKPGGLKPVDKSVDPAQAYPGYSSFTRRGKVLVGVNKKTGLKEDLGTL